MCAPIRTKLDKHSKHIFFNLKRDVSRSLFLLVWRRTAGIISAIIAQPAIPYSPLALKSVLNVILLSFSTFLIPEEIRLFSVFLMSVFSWNAVQRICDNILFLLAPLTLKKSSIPLLLQQLPGAIRATPFHFGQSCHLLRQTSSCMIDKHVSAP